MTDKQVRQSVINYRQARQSAANWVSYAERKVEERELDLAAVAASISQAWSAIAATDATNATLNLESLK